MFLYKNLFFSVSSILSIPIMLIGINGGYFPAICRVCLSFFDSKRNIGILHDLNVPVWTFDICVQSVVTCKTAEVQRADLKTSDFVKNELTSLIKL